MRLAVRVGLVLVLAAVLLALAGCDPSGDSPYVPPAPRTGQAPEPPPLEER